MKRIMVGGLILTHILACQARKQPEAPEEGAAASADSLVKGHAGTLPETPLDGEMTGIHPDADPGSGTAEFFPENCLALKLADPSLPSGTYGIHPFTGPERENTVLASCDMETDGGGWTLILNYNHKATTYPELRVRTDSLPLSGSDLLGMDESLQPRSWGHAGNELMRKFAGFRELMFYCRSSENTRVLHFKTADAACLSAVQLGNGSCANIRNNFVPMPDHTAILPGSLDRADSDRFDETLTYNTFGKAEADTPDRMWSIGAEPSQQAWECDYGTNDAMFHTLHRVWIR